MSVVVSRDKEDKKESSKSNNDQGIEDWVNDLEDSVVSMDFPEPPASIIESTNAFPGEEVTSEIEDTQAQPVILEPPPPRKIRENSQDFLKKQFQKVLSVFPQTLMSDKKKFTFMTLALHTAMKQDIDRVSRLLILKNFLLELRDTHLNKEQKKTIIVQFFDILFDAVIVDQEWYDALQEWLKCEIMSVIDFLFLYRPDDFRTVNQSWSWHDKK